MRAGQKVTSRSIGKISSLPKQAIPVKPFISLNDADVIYLPADDEDRNAVKGPTEHMVCGECLVRMQRGVLRLGTYDRVGSPAICAPVLLHKVAYLEVRNLISGLSHVRARIKEKTLSLGLVWILTTSNPEV